MKFNLELDSAFRITLQYFRYLQDQISGHSFYRNCHLNNPACSDDYVSWKRLETHLSETTIGVC